MNIKNFSIFKNKPSDNEKAPSHSISANIGTQEQPEYITIGACWTKDGQKGKFLSCKLQDVYKDHTTDDRTKSRVGFHVEEDGKKVVEDYTEEIDTETDSDSPF